MQKKQIYKNQYCADMARMARQQLALINRSRMHTRRGNGVASQPFYVLFINR